MVKAKEEEKKPQFKPGDFVKVKGASYHNFPDGQVVKVVRVDDYALKCIVCEGYCTGKRDIDTQYVKLEDLTPVK